MSELITEWQKGEVSNRVFLYTIRGMAATADHCEGMIEKALMHIEAPFWWCGLTVREMVAVQLHCAGKSQPQIGEITGKSQSTARQCLLLAVEKINKAEDWKIKIPDLADIQFKLIKEELDGTESGTGK